MFRAGRLLGFPEVAAMWPFLVGGEPGIDTPGCEAGLGGAVHRLGVDGSGLGGGGATPGVLEGGGVLLQGAEDDGGWR